MQTRIFLPLLTFPDPSAESSISNAVAVARRLNGRLHATALEVDVPDVSNALSRMLVNLPGMIRNAEALSAERGEALLAAAKSAGEAGGVPVSAGVVRGQTPLLGEIAFTMARYFDLTVLGWSDGSADLAHFAEATVFGSGRPTLIVPDRLTVSDFEHVAIAWDGSRVAARALADARPFLERASRVTVATVLDEKPLSEIDLGERLAEALRESGLPADHLDIASGGEAVGTALQQRTAEAGANLLVMGAYGHSRLREFVLGGATRGVLADPRMPVLISH